MKNLIALYAFCKEFMFQIHTAERGVDSGPVDFNPVCFFDTTFNQNPCSWTSKGFLGL